MLKPTGLDFNSPNFVTSWSVTNDFIKKEGFRQPLIFTNQLQGNSNILSDMQPAVSPIQTRFQAPSLMESVGLTKGWQFLVRPPTYTGAQTGTQKFSPEQHLQHCGVCPWPLLMKGIGDG